MRRKNDGFTLLELMVVMGILAVLAGTVFPAVSGTKSTGVATQAKTDAESVQKALDRFANISIKAGAFPEATLGSPGFYGNGVTNVGTDIATWIDLDGLTTIPNPSPSTHTAIDWQKSAEVWMQDGSVVSMSFVPNFLSRIPDSYKLRFVETNNKKEFLWLLKKESSGGESTRKVQVYRVVHESGGTVAIRLY